MKGGQAEQDSCRRPPLGTGPQGNLWPRGARLLVDNLSEALEAYEDAGQQHDLAEAKEG